MAEPQGSQEAPRVDAIASLAGWMYSHPAFRSTGDAAIVEIVRLRDALQWCAAAVWEDGNIDGGDFQHEMKQRGVLVVVRPTEAEREEWSLEPDDPWYVLAWSPRAPKS